jgi:hypothetical protein
MFNRGSNGGLNTADAYETSITTDHRSQDFKLIRLDCDSCGNFTLIQNEKSQTGYCCLLCGTEYGYDVPSSCDNCGAEETQGELHTIMLDEGRYERHCSYCSGYYHFDKDD